MIPRLTEEVNHIYVWSSIMDKMQEVKLTLVSVGGLIRIDVDSSYYDFTGRKMVNPVRGIYIRNGRKVVVQ